MAILANFPLHVIAPSTSEFQVQGHYATWLPPLAEAWSGDDGIKKYWITFSDAITERRDIIHWNQTFIVLPTQKKGRASSFFKADRLALAKVLGEIKPDVVHGWGTEDVYALAAVNSGHPSLISMQGILSHYILHAKMDSRSWFQALLELYILRKAKMISCETPWGANILRKRAPQAEISIVEYAVHADFFNAKWEPDPQHPVALFAGTLDRRKGFQDVLAAFGSPRLKDFELWVAGTGPLQDENSERHPNVKWLGRVDRPRLIEAMSKAWCLVLPTRADTSPNVVKEARVIGMPVVTTPRGGQSNYIVEGRNGFFVQPGDTALLGQRLCELLSDHTFCVTCGKEGWDEIRPVFQTSVMTEKFRTLYREIHRRNSTHSPR